MPLGKNKKKSKAYYFRTFETFREKTRISYKSRQQATALQTDGHTYREN